MTPTHYPLIKCYAWLPTKLTSGCRIWRSYYYLEQWDMHTETFDVIEGRNKYSVDETLIIALKGEKEINHSLLPFHNFVMFITDIKTITAIGLVSMAWANYV